MSQHDAKTIADDFFGDALSTKRWEGARCVVYQPSVFKSGYGSSTLLIDKNTLSVYQIPSHMGRFGDLPYEAYDNNWDIFHWPEGGGIAHAYEDKVLTKQIADIKKTNWRANPDDAVLLLCYLDSLAAHNLKLKETKFADVEVLLLEAIEIQMQHPTRVGNGNANPLERYLYQLKIKNRLEEKEALEKRWEAAKGSKNPIDKSASSQSSPHATPSTSAQQSAQTLDPGLPPSAEDEAALNQASQLLFEAADAEDAKDYKLAETNYQKAIAILKDIEAGIDRDNFLIMAFASFGRVLIAQEQFAAAMEPLTAAVSFYQASNNKDELSLPATICVQLLGECLNALGRASELEALARALDPR